MNHLDNIVVNFDKNSTSSLDLDFTDLSNISSIPNIEVKKQIMFPILEILV